MPTTDNARLLILWTSGDPLTARDMVLLYAVNAMKHDWWTEVTLLVWGAADSLIAEDNEIQSESGRPLMLACASLPANTAPNNKMLPPSCSALALKFFTRANSSPTGSNPAVKY